MTNAVCICFIFIFKPPSQIFVINLVGWYKNRLITEYANQIYTRKVKNSTDKINRNLADIRPNHATLIEAYNQ